MMMMVVFSKQFRTEEYEQSSVLLYNCAGARAWGPPATFCVAGTRNQIVGLLYVQKVVTPFI